MQHRLDLKKDSNTAYLTLEVGQVDAHAIDEFSTYLTENIHHLMEIATHEHRGRSHEFFAIRVEIDNAHTIPERVMWANVVQNLPNAVELITNYINKVCELTTRNDTAEFTTTFGPSELSWADPEHPIGSHALIEYVDWASAMQDFERQPVGGIYEAFMTFLRHCDLDHETWQDEYISRFLTKFHHTASAVELDKLFALLYFRLFNGQSILIAAEKDFRYLYRFLCYKGGLKRIVDSILSDDVLQKDYADCEEFLYLKLCACVYGSDEEKTGEILNYVQRSVNERLIPCVEHQRAELRTIRAECDEFLAMQLPAYEQYKAYPNCPQDLDSGFHRYSIANDTWARTDGWL